MRVPLIRSTIFLLTLCSVLVHTLVGFAASQANQPPTDRPNSTQLLIKGSQLYIVDAQSRRLSVQQLDRATEPQIAPVERANTLWSGFPLDSPTGIATDSSEALYVADPRGKTIFVIRPNRRPPEIVFSGAPLEFPTGVAIDKSRVFITDPGARSIFSLNLSTHEIYTEYHQSSGQFPDKIIWANKSLYAYSPETKAVIRLFSERDSSKSDPFFKGQSESWSVPSSDPTVVRRGEVLSWKNGSSQAIDFGVAHDVVYLLDPTGRHISLLPLLGGVGTQLTIPDSFGTASQIAVTDDLLCILTSSGIVSMHTVVPAVISYGRASYSSESSSLYAYLASRGLLRIGQDNGQERESSVHLLLDVPVRNVPSRELVELPLKKDSKIKPPAHFDGTLGQIAKELAPEETSKGDLSKSLSKLNYWYKGDNILDEKRGFFLVPTESTEVIVPLPVEAIINRHSDFYTALSANVTVDSPILYGGLVEQSVVTTETRFVQGGTSDAQPTTDPNCVDLPKEDWTSVLTLIHYCLPKEAASSNLGVIERHVDTSHPEFAPSSLKRYAAENASKPTQSDPQQQQFNLEWDHGTHIAGLIGAHSHSHKVFGIDPKATIWGIKPGDFSKALNSDPDGPDLSELRVFNVSLGESDLNDAANQGVGVDSAGQLKALIDNPIYLDKLFVVAAGDVHMPVSDTALAARGLRSNVVVVGAATLSEPIGPSDHSGFGWKYVDIFAPGENIVSSLYGGGYGSATGTSQATALVSGTAALLDSLVSWPPWQIKQRILSSADLWTDGPYAESVRTGMLNVKAAVLHPSQAVLEFWVPPSNPSDASGTPGQPCVGRIQYAGVKGELRILRPGQSPLAIKMSDIRRFHRNPNDHTFTIFYTRNESTKQTIDPGNLIGLERLMHVQGSDLRGATKFEFISDDPNCNNKTTIGWTELSEMINGFY